MVVLLTALIIGTTIQERNKLISEKEGSIQQLEAELGEMIKQKIELDTQIENLNNTIREKDKQLQSKAEAKRVAQTPKKVYALTGVEQWRPLCEKHFGSQANNCLRVMKGESGGNPNAVSRTDDHGLMQINGRTWVKFFGVTRAQLKDPETNVRLAKVIYDRAGGWSPWVAAQKMGL